MTQEHNAEIVQSRMVVLARESRGLTQRELSDRLGVTQGEISRIEGGLRGVSADLLERMSHVLHYPESFFLLDERIVGLGIGDMFHRKRQDISARTLGKIHAAVNIKRIHLSRLLMAADVEPCRIFSLEDHEAYSELTSAKITDIAQRVRAMWMLPAGPIENLSGAIEDAGGVVIRCDFETSRVDAISQRINGLPPLFFVNSTIPQDRLRYSLAHELGHLVLHHNSRVVADPTLSPRIEQQANLFAAELLLPERDVRADLMDLTIPRLAVLKPFWRVSMAALLKRAQDLATITTQRATTLWQQLSRRGYRRREPAELDLRCESASVLRELIDLHEKGLGFSPDELGSLLHIFPDEVTSEYLPHLTPRRLGNLRVVVG